MQNYFPLNIASFAGTTAVIPDSLYKGPDLPSFPIMMFKMVISLAVVMVLIYLMLLFVRKFSKHGNLSGGIDPSAKIIGIFPLNNKQLIYIIYIFEEILLLGSSGDSLNLLDKITDKEKIASILQASQMKKGLNFEDILEKFSKKNKKTD